VGRLRRAGQLLVQGGLLLVALVLGVVLEQAVQAQWAAAGNVLLGLLVISQISWACLARGGATFGMFGIALVRADGRRAARWQAGWRAFLAWVEGSGLVLGLVGLYRLLLPFLPDPPNTAGVWLGYGLCALFPAYVLLAVWLPRRPLHDRLAGTYLVPE
jgi:hypothetical protein